MVAAPPAKASYQREEGGRAAAPWRRSGRTDHVVTKRARREGGEATDSDRLLRVSQRGRARRG